MPPPDSGAPTTTGAGIAVGDFYACALTSGGGVKCWGIDNEGQLGNGTMTGSHVPVAVTGLASGVVAIAAGNSHTCALTLGGGVVCWGDNTYGQLGDGSTTNRLTPAAVTGLASGVAAIAAGGFHTCALASLGAVKCWGANQNGELGDGSTTQRRAPVAVSGLSSGVTAISVGGAHSCAVASGGAAKCWGFDAYGELGDGSTTSKSVPVAVTGLSSGVVAVAAGQTHTCALTAVGGVRCWGDNAYGQLGDGSRTDNSLPVAVTGMPSGASAIAAGAGTTCAVTIHGAAMCWGHNGYGELGDGTNTSSAIPVGVTGLYSGVAAIAANVDDTCALTKAGRVLCWGSNGDGQLGDGTIAESHDPVTVVGF